MAGCSPVTLDETTQDDNFQDLRKKLCFDTPQVMKGRRLGGDGVLRACQPIEVYLRIRPQPYSTDGVEDTFLTYTNDSVLAIPPKATHRSQENEKFMFTKVYAHAASQNEIFHESVTPLVENFFDGQDCLLLAYGVTNSGKTYTMTGTPTQPGLLPRALDVIFSSIGQNLFTSAEIKPKFHSEVVYLTDNEQELEKAIKDNLLNQTKPCNVSDQLCVSTAECADASTFSNTLCDVTCQSGMTDETCSLVASIMGEFDIQEDLQLTVDTQNGALSFSLFISYAEIYNELIYDLLEDKPLHGRPSLKLAADRYGNPYIKGLREVKVDSSKEALQLLRIGMARRHSAATRLNYTSSRSHSIYTVKLIRVTKSVRRPKVARINRFSVVDLAGTERSKKTGAKGERIKEAGSINTSLLTLGRCIEAIRLNQNTSRRNDSKLVPFRDSKLTQLLQTYFVGKGKGAREGRVVMFVNVGDVNSVFDETYHVLKFSALASKIVPIVKTVPRLPELSSIKEHIDLSAEGDNHAHCVQQMEALKEQCRKEAAEYRKEIAELKMELWEKEYKVRQQVSQEYNQQIVEIEEHYNREMEEHEEMMEKEFEKRLLVAKKSVKKLCNTRKRVRTDSADADEFEELLHLRKEILHLKENLQDVTEELELERTKSTAVLRDLSTTYETKMTRLNDQINLLNLRCKTEVANKETELTAMSKEIDKMKQEYERMIDEMEKTNEKKMSEIQNLLDEEQSKSSSLTRELLEVQETLAISEERLCNTTVTSSSGGPWDDLKAALDKSEQEKERLESQYETETEALLLKVIQLESSCKLLTERIDTSSQTDPVHLEKKNVAKLQEQLDMMTEALAEKEVEISLLKNQKEKLQCSLSSEVYSLSEERDDAKKSLRKEREQFVLDKEALEHESVSLKHQLSQLQLRKEETEKENQLLKGKTVLLEETLASLKAETDKQSESKIQKKNDCIQQLEADIKHQQVQFTKRHESLLQEKAQLMEKLKKSENNEEAKANELAELTNLLAEQKSEAMERHSLLESKVQKIQHLEMNIEQQQVQLKDVMKCNGSLLQENAQLMEELKILRDRLTMAEEAKAEKMESDYAKEEAEIKKILTEHSIEEIDRESLTSEHIYDLPPEDPTYDSVHVDDVEDHVLHERNSEETIKDNLNETGRYLQPLERSSQLHDDSMDDFEPPKRTVQYNMLTDAKKKKPAKAKPKPRKTKKDRGDDTDEEVIGLMTTPQNPHRYNLRGRKGKATAAAVCEDGDSEVDENVTPSKSIMKKIFKAPRLPTTTKKKKPIIDKSQISAPLDYIDTPESHAAKKNSRPLRLGGHVRPASKLD